MIMIDGIFGNAFETDGKDLGGMSIVFGCHDTYHTRSFCAPFESLTSSLERLYQNEKRSNVDQNVQILVHLKMQVVTFIYHFLVNMKLY